MMRLEVVVTVKQVLRQHAYPADGHALRLPPGRSAD